MLPLQRHKNCNSYSLPLHRQTEIVTVAHRRVVYEGCVSGERGRGMGGLWGQAEGIYWKTPHVFFILFNLAPPPPSPASLQSQAVPATQREESLRDM